MCMQR